MIKNFLLVFFLFLPSVCSANTTTVVYNKSQDSVAVSHNQSQTRSIASITKVMTAMVYLDQQQFLETKIRLQTPVRSNLPQQDYRRRDLLAAMLVRSDNAAAETLARDYPGGRDAFIRAMNVKAQSLNMLSTQFVDPSGLGLGNQSTATDLVAMLLASVGYPVIREASVSMQATFETRHQQKIKHIKLPNTNLSLLLEFDSIIISKTGYTTPAGWCVGMVVEKDRQVYVVVVLGSHTKQERYVTAKNLMINHIPNQPIESLELDWGF
jgi:D-alanyl-D-alanine endopeptidase (penicillin-binding protein 7)